MNEPVLPIIHSNGSSLKELMELRHAALRALRQAQAGLDAMTPNGRDYYPEAGLYGRAIEQHERRKAAVDSLVEELTVEYMALNDRMRR